MGDLRVSITTLESGASAVLPLTGPLTGLVAGTLILTLEGELPVQFLSPGDRIVTRSGARVLRGIEVTVLQEATMIRVSASALGPDRPEDDMFVAPAQPLLVRDWRAQAMFGQNSAMVEAQRLTDGEYIRRETVAEIRLFTLRFDREEVVYAGGLEVACPPATVTA